MLLRLPARPAKPRPSGVGSRRARTLLVAATVLLVAGCGGAVPPEAPGGASGTGSSGLFDPVGHVHGAGVDPADGSVVIAGHYGLFSLTPDGRLAPRHGRAGAPGPDLMGFTVAGPGTFLASGHPAPDDARTPNPVGLVRSVDGGATWEPVSLQGRVDFHALAAAGTTVVGLDATRGVLMTSADGGRTWQDRAGLDALDVAVDPSDGSRVLATTEDGVAASRDGGTSFDPVAGGPLLAFLSWAADGTVYGVGPDGTVHVSTDRGATWQRGGATAGSPQAVTAQPGGRLTVVTEDGVHRSTDGGRTLQRIA